MKLLFVVVACFLLGLCVIMIDWSDHPVEVTVVSDREDFVSLPVSSLVDPPSPLWNQVIDKSDNEYCYSVIQTSDGGFAAVGFLENTTSTAHQDGFLLKTDASGNELFCRTFGGSGNEVFHQVQETTDSGFIIVGNTDTYGNGNVDFWLVKTNSSGIAEWNVTFGGSEYDYGRSVDLTSDGGFIIAGRTNSSGGEDYDFWVIKTNSSGVESWNYTYGGADHDSCYNVKQHGDDFLLTGETRSYADDLRDIWLLRIQDDGSEVWNLTYHESLNDVGYSLDLTDDGGCIITGYSSPHGTGMTSDAFVIKIDQNGAEEWRQNYGGDLYDYGNDIVQTADGGYAVVGYTNFDASAADLWLFKLNQTGVVEWEYPFGGDQVDIGYALDQTSDGGLILGGITNSYSSGDDKDIWMIRFDDEPPSTVYVDDDFNSSTLYWNLTHFSTIQQAIENVSENGTVLVYNGTYYENILINKTINLVGEHRNSTVIDGQSAETVVHVNSNWSRMSDIRINGTGSNGTVFEDGVGNNTFINCTVQITGSSSISIFLRNHCDNNLFQNCILLDFSEYGIYNDHCKNNNFSNCIISSSLSGADGIGLWQNSMNNTIRNCSFSNIASESILLRENSSFNSFYNCNLSNVGNRGILLREYCSNNSFMNCNVSCDTTLGYGIIAREHSNNNSFVNCSVSESGSFGIYLKDSCSNCSFLNCSVSHSESHGFYIENDCDYNSFLNCTVSDCGNTGIYLYNDCDLCLFRNCTVDGESTTGISLLDSCNNCSFINCSVSNVGYGLYIGNQCSFCSFIECTVDTTLSGSGIYLFDSCSNCSFINCTVDTSLGSGIYLFESCSNCSFINCSISESSSIGIYLFDSCSNCSFTNCSVDNSDSQGFYIYYNCNFTTLTNCTITNSKRDGIYFRDTCCNNTLSDITIRDNEGCGIYFNDHCNFNSIVNNSISNHNESGIHLYMHCLNNSFVNCSISECDDYGIYLYKSCSNCSFVNCSVSDSNRHGISLRDTCENCSFTNCSIKRNEWDGIDLIKYCNYSLFTNCILLDNAQKGISLDNNCKNNTITNSSIGFNKESGIYIESSDNTIISGNSIVSNQNIGIELLSSSNNNIYHNDLIDNTNNGYDNQNNYWYNEALDEGNYWDNYTGVDSNGNGTGDTPYNISGGDNQDKYPLITPRNLPPNKALSPSPSNENLQQNINVDLSWVGSDPDSGDVVTYDVYFGTGSSPPKIVGNVTHSNYELPVLQPGTLYYWYIISWDNHLLSNTSKLWYFKTSPRSSSSSDQDTDDPPQISNVEHTPSLVGEKDSIRISAKVTDDEAVESVVLYWNDNMDHSKTMTLQSNNLYTATIGPFSVGRTVTYWVVASDNASQQRTSVTASLLVHDQSPPKIIIRHPLQNSLIYTTQPQIKLTLSDSSGVDASSIICEIDGTIIKEGTTVTDTTFLYIPKTPLTIETHQVRISVSDTLGNQASRSWEFTILDPAELVEQLVGNLSINETRQISTNTTGTVQQISFTSTSPLSNVKYMLVSHSAKPAPIPEIPWEDSVVKEYFDLELTQDDITITHSAVSGVTISFQIPYVWIEENNINRSTIRLCRYHNGSWENLSTTWMYDEDSISYFQAETPGFSTFSVVGNTIIEVPDPYAPQTPEIPWTVVVLVLVLCVILLVIVLFRGRFIYTDEGKKPPQKKKHRRK